MIERSLYLAGRWVRGSGEPLRVYDPSTEDAIALVDTPSQDQIDTAVRRASEVANELRRTPGTVRAGWLRKAADSLKDAHGSMAALEAQNVGKPLPEARLDVDDAIACLQYFADLAESMDHEQQRVIAQPLPHFSVSVRHEPVGVSALIIPWNFPLLTTMWKLAPAVAAGCPCIVKPSEFTPLSALAFAELIRDCGLPDGAVSILCGLGASVGEPLCRHPLVKKISFTGSSATGRHVAAIAGAQLKRLTIEAGGKSALIVFADTPVDVAVEWILFGGLYNQGQVCNATTRVLIEESLYPEVLERVVREVSRLVIGPPGQDGVQMGPLQNRPQYEKFLRYVALGQAAGARLLCGGDRHPAHRIGLFVRPAVFDQVSTTAQIWREEVFGPLLAFRPFRSEDQAIDAANDSPYGLAAAVLTADSARADRVAAAMEAGCVWQNCNGLAFVQAPWGGVKDSGVGRELGRWGLESFQEVKQITRYSGVKPWGWYLK